VPSLCFQMAVDLFDAVEIIDIVLEEREHSYGIPKGFDICLKQDLFCQRGGHERLTTTQFFATP